MIEHQFERPVFADSVTTQRHRDFERGELAPFAFDRGRRVIPQVINRPFYIRRLIPLDDGISDMFRTFRFGPADFGDPGVDRRKRNVVQPLIGAVMGVFLWIGERTAQEEAGYIRRLHLQSRGYRRAT